MDGVKGKGSMDPEKMLTPDACRCFATPDAFWCFATEWNSQKIMSIIRVCEKVIPKLLITAVILKEFPNIYLSVS